MLSIPEPLGDAGMWDRLTPCFPSAGSGTCSLVPATSVTARSSASLRPPASVGPASIAPSFRFTGCQERDARAQPAIFTEEPHPHSWWAGDTPKHPLLMLPPQALPHRRRLPQPFLGASTPSSPALRLPGVLRALLPRWPIPTPHSQAALGAPASPTAPWEMSPLVLSIIKGKVPWIRDVLKEADE